MPSKLRAGLGARCVLTKGLDRCLYIYTMEDWEKRLNGFLSLMDREVLANAGRISAELAKAHAESEWEKYRIVQDRLYTSDFDRFVQLEERAADKEKGGEQ